MSESLEAKLDRLEGQVGRMADLTTQALSRVSTLANMASTLVDCIGVLTSAQDDDGVKIEVAAKLGAFAMTEHREPDAE